LSGGVPPKDSDVAVDVTLPATPTPNSPAGAGLSSGRRYAGPPAYAEGELIAERYRIVRPLGEGGMGEVYEAEDLLLKERVALKTLRGHVAEDETSILRFKREIQLARRVTHPNVCRIFDVGLDRRGGRESAFLTMELLHGETLAARIRRDGKLTTAEAGPLVEQVAAALGAAHAAGVIHRDLKCANVLLTKGEGGAVRPVVTDFGLARAAAEGGEQVTGDGGIVGSPAYMAPEQVEGRKLTSAADIYALGVVMFEMVTGRLPFLGDSPLSTAVMRIREDAPSPKSITTDLDPRWERTILACLARKPEDRPASAAEVVRGLRGDTTFTSGALPAATTNLGPKPRRRRWRILGGIAIACLVLGVIANLAEHQSGPVQAEQPVPPEPPEAPDVVGAVPPVPPVPPGPHGPGRWRLPRIEVPRIVRSGSGEAFLAPRSAVTQRRAIAILGFRNLSGKKEADYLSTALAEMLATELAAGKDLRIVPGESVARARKQLDLSAGEMTFAADTLRKMHSLIDADFVVTGSYMLQGDNQVRLDVRLQETARGDTVSSTAQMGDLSDLSSLVEEVADGVREGLSADEPSEDEREESRALMPRGTDVTRLYSEGLALMRVDHCAAARGPLEEAVAADPAFALAHQALSEVLDCLGYDTRALEEAQKAVELSKDLPPEIRLQAEATFYERTGQWDKALASYEALYARAPDNYDFGLKLLRFQRKHAPDEARRTLAQLRKLASDGERPELDLTEAMLIPGDKEKAVALGKARAQAEASGARLVAATAALQAAEVRVRIGALDEALVDARRAKEIFEASGDRDGVIQALSVEARVFQKRGDKEGAKRALRDATELGKQLDSVRSLVGFEADLGEILLQQGDLDGAERAWSDVIRLQQRAGKKAQEVTSRLRVGMLSLLRGDARRAEREIDDAYEMADDLEDAAEAQGWALFAEAKMGVILGNPAAARKLASRAVGTWSGLKEQGVDKHLESIIAFAEGDLDAAETAARAAMKFDKLDRYLGPTGREQILIEVLLEAGKTAEAKGFLEGMRAKLSANDAFADRLMYDILSARARAASGKRGDQQAALTQLALVSKRAKDAGFGLMFMLAELASARITHAIEPSMGATSLPVVAREAKKRGLILISERAVALLQKSGG